MHQRLAAVAAFIIAVGVGREGPASPSPQRRGLPNGLEIIVAENQVTPLVSLMVAVRHGYAWESARETGRAHLLEHMLFRPNDVWPTDGALEAHKRALGVGIFGGTSEVLVHHGLTTTAANLRPALELLRDMIVSPRFDAATLATEKQIIANEEHHRDPGPANVPLDDVHARLWWKHPTRKSDAGQAERLATCSPEDLRRLHARVYVPANAALIVVGAVQPTAVMSAAAEVFGGWQGGPPPHAATPPVRHPGLRRSEVIVAPLDGARVAGSFLWHGPSSHGREALLAHAARVVESAFELGPAAGEPLRRSCGAVGVKWLPSPNVGVLQLAWEARPEAVDACVRDVVANFATVARALDDAQLARARAHAEGALLREREDPEARALGLAAAWAADEASARGTSRARPQSIAPTTGLGAVDRTNVAALIDRFVVGQHFLLVVRPSPTQIAAGLDVAHFQRLLRATAKGTREGAR